MAGSSINSALECNRFKQYKLSCGERRILVHMLILQMCSFGLFSLIHSVMHSLYYITPLTSSMPSFSTWRFGRYMQCRWVPKCPSGQHTRSYLHVTNRTTTPLVLVGSCCGKIEGIWETIPVLSGSNIPDSTNIFSLQHCVSSLMQVILEKTDWWVNVVTYLSIDFVSPYAYDDLDAAK